MSYSELYCPSEPHSENQRKQKEEQVLEPCLRTKKAVEYQRIGKEVGRVRRINQEHPDYSIVEISQNIEKSHGYLMRLALYQTLVKDYQLNLV